MRRFAAVVAVLLSGCAMYGTAQDAQRRYIGALCVDLATGEPRIGLSSLQAGRCAGMLELYSLTYPEDVR